MVEKLKSFNLTFVLLALGCLFGGLKDGWFVFPSGILICVLLVLRLKRTGCIYISKKLNIIFLLLLFCAGLSIFEAISLGDTIGGLLKLVIIGIYIVWCMQMTEEEKTEAIADIPKLGILVMVASALLIFLPYFRDRMINKAGRLSGTIGYSNTLALIFLISLAVYLEHDKVESKQLNRDKSIYFSIMILGILWTGSRFTIVLTVLYLISLVIRRKKINRYYWLSIVVMLAVAYVYSMVSGNMRGIARIGTLFSNSSTLIGRIIYWKDGIKVLFEHSIGMGSMGWFLTQEATQNAPYVVKFVHNSFLQAGLDYGIGFMVLSVVLSVISII